MIEWILIFFLLSTVFILFFLYIRQTGMIESRAQEIFETWRMREQDDLSRWKVEELGRLSDEKAATLFEGWKKREENTIRLDAVKRSESVTRGKITEHLIPFFLDFPYNPRDARFLGSPVDLIVFDGLSNEKITEIVFVEIKTSRNPTLTRREREVRDCVDEKRVSYRMIRQVPGDFKENREN